MNGLVSSVPAVRVEGVVKRFGATVALGGAGLEIPGGTVFGLLGPNGAGKTTLVRILATLLTPDAGRAEVLGRDVAREPAAVRELLGLTGQFAAVDEILTGRENLEMFGRLFGLSRAEARRRAGELLERFDLVDAADRPAPTYSGGMRPRLDRFELIEDAAAECRRAGVDVSELGLRGPTLDDVFLKLTGAPPSEDGAGPQAPADAEPATGPGGVTETDHPHAPTLRLHLPS